MTMLKIGTNRNKRRIWLEGTPLLKAGFAHGARYSRTIEDDYIVGNGVISLWLDPDGKYKVAGTPQRPIVDICGDWVTRWAGSSDSVESIIGLRLNTIILERK